MAGLVERGLDDGRLLAEETSDAQAVTHPVAGLVFVDELERAHKLIHAMLVNAQRRGSVAGFVVFSLVRGVIALRRGELAEAEANSRAAYERVAEHGLIPLLPFSAADLGLTLLERGNLE